MNRHFHPLTLPYFAILIFFIANHFPTISCAQSNEYISCSSSYKCGDIHITYPFYGAENRPDYCGYLGFQVSCAFNVLTIDIWSLTYRILKIDSRTQTLTVARDDYWRDYCVDHLYNTSMESSSIFKYGSTTAQYQLSLYYSCNSSVSTMVSAANQYNCTLNETSNTGYYMTSGSPSQAEAGIAALLGACKDSVNLPIFESGFAILNSHPSLDNLIATIRGGFGLEWYANNGLCGSCLISGGSCGRNLYSNKFVCYCTSINAYASICDTPDSDSGPALSLKTKVIIGLVSSVSPFIIFLIICCLRKKCVLARESPFTENDMDIDAFLKNCGSLAPKQYKYSDVEKMTNSFRHKLGQGGYGCVYKGRLSDGRLVAVKVLSDSKGNGEDFLNEIASISRTSHVNVVTLLGFSYERNNSALIYEFMPKGSLDRYIYIEPSSNAKYHLRWRTLSKIATGIARGLEYLHSGCNTRILHFDIKPHNILLDQDFCPKISDFGLARLCKKKGSIISMTGMRGTIGYIAPEVVSRLFGGVSYKSDVYSYGMMLLEMARGGQKMEVGLSQTSEIYFPDWVYKQLEPGMELRLARITTEEEEVIARKMILVGLWCIQTKPSDRPSMSKVVEMLEGSIDSLQIPPKPVLSSPPRSTHQYSSTLSSLS